MYEVTLEATHQMPETSGYRQSVEWITRERLSFVKAYEKSNSHWIYFDFFLSPFISEGIINPLVDDTEAIEQYPEHLKALSLESLLEDAKTELSLSKKMATSWQPWLPLEHRAPNGVWPLNLSTPTGPTYK